jgi:hypothetical protein
MLCHIRSFPLAATVDEAVFLGPENDRGSLKLGVEFSGERPA